MSLKDILVALNSIWHVRNFDDNMRMMSYQLKLNQVLKVAVYVPI